MTEKKKRKTPRQLTAAFYLGIKETRDRRIADLDKIAARLGRNRSELIQDIADGKLEVIEK